MELCDKMINTMLYTFFTPRCDTRRNGIATVGVQSITHWMFERSREGG